jgi:hypothetical protein
VNRPAAASLSISRMAGCSCLSTPWVVDLERGIFVFLGNHHLPKWARCLLGLVVFLLLATGFSIAAESIPCVEWASPGFATFYREPKFSPGAVLFFVSQLVLGYCFNTLVVNGAGIGIFKERLRGKAFAITLYATVLYFLGSIFVLNGSCDNDASTGSRIATAVLTRTVAFSLPFCIGLHWTLMDSIPGMGEIVLNPAWIRRWKKRQWTAFAIGLSIGLSAAAYDFYLLWSIGRLGWYLLAFFGTLFLFGLFSWLISNRYRLHFHHYCFAAMAIFFPVRESPFSAVAQGIFLGIGLDGLCRWGPDPLFYPLSKEELEAIAKEKAAKAALKASAAATAPLLPASAGSTVGAAGGAVITGDGSQVAASGKVAVVSLSAPSTISDPAGPLPAVKSPLLEHSE